MGEDAKSVLRIAAAAEQYSTHPIADAIVSAARDQGLDLPHGTDHRVWSGLGVEATIEGERVRVGQRRFFESDGASLPADFVPHAERMQRQGMTVVVVNWSGHYAALGLSDLPRPEAGDLVRGLRDLGVRRVVMITGDNIETANAVARQIGVDEVYAGLMPDEKSALIRKWNNEGRTVMMVGDGVNDAPSLAEAAVGVAMGGLGSDIALNAADVVLVHDRLERILEFMRLGARTRRIIRWNLLFGGGVVVTLTALSVLISLPLPVAVIGHEGSTVIVILNGLRLLRGPGRDLRKRPIPARA
jgi:Cd2+/Zn2+-exporting ATPase